MLMPALLQGRQSLHCAPGAAPRSSRSRPARTVVARPALQHGRGTLLEGLDAHGQKPQHILVDAHVALHLHHGRRGRVEVHEHVVALAVLLDAVGEVAQTPIFPLRHLAALLDDNRGKGLGQRFDLGGRGVLARDKDVLVERHSVLLPMAFLRSGAGGKSQHQPPGPSRSPKGRQGLRRNWPRRSGALYTERAAEQPGGAFGVYHFEFKGISSAFRA